MTRVALVHAMKESIEPIENAFDRLWPEAELMNLLDDRLSTDRAREGSLSESMIGRFLALGRYAVAAGADAILFTCSAFGAAIDKVAADLPSIPVHKPNQSLLEELGLRGGRVGVLATFAPTLSSMVGELPAALTVVSCHCAGALEALKAGDGKTHDAIAARAAATSLSACDVIVLAQFSLARAADAVALATGKPVVSTPDFAVKGLRRRFA